ncbi:hypothetical protein MLD38_016551 [Melastoma candidum]|uniref:Uncharacterized protein n=1 Tax=Melastoma candidum TaxID=119954 RepID=A0ACB9QNZ1_9MYRT|nr:hypothetical protein MLD38_016551 [Melastoma candidum]
MDPILLRLTSGLSIWQQVMALISDNLWEIIRSDDGMKIEIAETVQSVYDKLKNPLALLPKTPRSLVAAAANINQGQIAWRKVSVEITFSPSNAILFPSFAVATTFLSMVLAHTGRIHGASFITLVWKGPKSPAEQLANMPLRTAANVPAAIVSLR